jgi:SAM-dependent methyltransferase
MTWVDELEAIAERFPAPPDDRHYFTLRNRRNWAERTAYDIGLIVDRIGRNGRVCDVGGGYGLVAIGCAKLGMEAVLIEDFYEMEKFGTLDQTLALMGEYGVHVKRRDIIADGLDLEPASFDAMTLFHVLEHLPFSPKQLLHEMAAALRSGGAFVVAGPNAVNLRKRISVPLGTAHWSPMEDWYESDRFRGHVREPTVGDLVYIAEDLGLEQVSITGRNFLGYASTNPTRRRMTTLADRVIRARPALCSDIYLVGTKPGRGPNR